LGACEDSGKVNSRGGLTDATFLICYRYYSCHRGAKIQLTGSGP